MYGERNGFLRYYKDFFDRFLSSLKKGWAINEEVKSKYVYCTGKDFLWLVFLNLVIFNNLVKKIIF